MRGTRRWGPVGSIAIRISGLVTIIVLVWVLSWRIFFVFHDVGKFFILKVISTGQNKTKLLVRFWNS